MKSRTLSYSPCIRVVCEGDGDVGGVLVAGSLVSDERNGTLYLNLTYITAIL